MSSLFRKIKNFARSPEGRRMMNQAKSAARDPRNKQKARMLISKLRGGRKHY